MECNPVSLWPLLLIPGAVGVVLGCLIGASWATAKAERMIRGGRRPLR
ncbi:MAG: hypothetical protein JRE40_04050 [Deltaproteobacteria bacterium]|nr:hypothetical protein [Deltaproteobacteria bacterium]